MKNELDELKELKHQAVSVSRLQQDISELQQGINYIEAGLRSTGLTKTLQEARAQMNAFSNDLLAFYCS